MGTEIQFVQYLHQMRDYNDQHPTTKGLILLGIWNGILFAFTGLEKLRRAFDL